MESQNKLGQTDIETLHLVLQEILEEPKIIRQGNEASYTTTQEILKNLELIKQMTKNLSKSLNGSESQDAQKLAKEVQLIKLLITGRPQPIVRKLQILLFPEQDAKLFYKIVFGRWFLWIFICLLAGYVFKWSMNWTATQKEIEMEKLENTIVVNAWNDLYLQKNKDLHRRMDSALLRAEHPNIRVSK